ncbi:MAG: FHA domain-containing protein [Myxococcaceae bacterium]
MAFQLRVARGHQQGRSYLIAQGRLRLGSAEGNDVVLSDAGISGAHLQIVEREGRYFVSDLSSANGTYVNGEAVKAERELKTGDALAIGAALLSFVQVEGDKKATPLVPVETHDDTRPESLGRQPQNDDLKGSARGDNSTDRVKPKVFGDDDATAPLAEPLGKAMAPLVDPETTAPEARPLGSVSEPIVKKELYERPRPSDAINAMLDRELGVQREEPSHDSLPPIEISRSELSALRGVSEPSDSNGRAKPWDSGDQSQPSGQSLSISQSVSVTPVNDGEPTADERPGRHTDAIVPSVRRRGLWGWFDALPGWAKMTGAAVLGLLVVLVGAAIVRAVRGPSEPALPQEPTELTADPVDVSFGLGQGVVYEQSDQKTFEFDLPASPASMVLVHYEASDIGAKEVAIMVNNNDLGFVPADTVEGRQLEVLVPPDQLKPGQKNTITFDNLQNPPGRETWRVSRLSLLVQHLSPLVAEEAVAGAQQKIDEGNALYVQQKAAPDNLFKAWVAYREAYLMLIANGTTKGKAMLPVARAKAEEVGLQLDKECGRLLTAAKKEMDDAQPQEARASLQKIADEFSSGEHPCQARAAEKREEYMLK